jgi:hypothetical protein
MGTVGQDTRNLTRPRKLRHLWTGVMMGARLLLQFKLCSLRRRVTVKSWACHNRKSTPLDSGALHIQVSVSESIHQDNEALHILYGAIPILLVGDSIPVRHQITAKFIQPVCYVRVHVDVFQDRNLWGLWSQFPRKHINYDFQNILKS